MRAGLKTSEFLLCVVVIAAATALLVFGHLTAEHWTALASLVTTGYGGARTWAKHRRRNRWETES